MHRTAQIVLASLFAAALTTTLNAGIVLTAQRTSPQYDQNVKVNLYATWDGNQTAGLSLGNSANVSAYQFRVTIAEPISSLSAAHIQQSDPFTTSAWKDVTPYAVIPGSSPQVDIGTRTVTFRAANEPVGSVVNSATIGTLVGTSTLLGSMNFTTTAGLVNLSFTSLVQQEVPAITGFGYIASGTLAATSHTFSGPTVQIVVVPEPSTFALCGLASVVGLWRARRKLKTN